MSKFLLLILFSGSLLASQDVMQLFEDLNIVHQVNEESIDRLPFHYNYGLMGGYLSMPSARMNQVGSVALGFSYLPPYRIFGATIQPFDRLELAINYTTYHGVADPVMGKKGFGDFSDRGLSLKCALLKKSDGLPLLPEISVGFEDFYGTKRFHAFYAAVTEELLRYNLEATLGWGKGRIRGFFGGVQWSPLRKSKIKVLKETTLFAEWDGKDYAQHLYEHPKGREVKTALSVGISAQILDHLQLTLSSIRGKRCAGSIAFHTNIGETKGLFPKIDDPSPGASSTRGFGQADPLQGEKELSAQLEKAFSKQRIILTQVYLLPCKQKEKELYLKVINPVYLHESEFRSRIEAILSDLVPLTIESIRVVIEADGVLAQQYQYQTADLKRLREGKIGEFEFLTLSPMRAPTPLPHPYEATQLFDRKKSVWKFSIRPRLITYFGSEAGKLRYSLGVVGGPEGYLFDEVYYKLFGGLNAFSNLLEVGDRDRLNPSQILNVRSDSVKYVRGPRAFIDEAYLQKGFYLSNGWYSRVGVGYFESAYGGVATEFLYYPVGSRWAIGLEGAIVMKRKPHGLGFTNKIRKFEGLRAVEVNFIGVEYFLDLYHDIRALNLDVKVSMGQFLARDKGAGFELVRYFPSGCRFGVWYTLTNAVDIVNGSRYRDKGFSLEIPLDLFLTKSSRTLLPYSLSVWLRDTGARSRTGKRLYPTLHGERGLSSF